MKKNKNMLAGIIAAGAPGLFSNPGFSQPMVAAEELRAAFRSLK